MGLCNAAAQSGGAHRFVRRVPWRRLAPLLLLGLCAGPAAAQECDAWRAQIIAAEGTVEFSRAASTTWVAATLGDALCVGDSIRVQLYSRAALLLPDETVLRLDQNTTLTWAEPQDDNRSWVELLKGIIHVISRDPRALKFTTPFANAGLEGTEFLIDVTNDTTSVTVLEGVVVMDNTAGSVNVGAGERGVARRDAATTVTAAADAQQAVQWALYYTPILARQLPPADQAVPAAQAGDPAFFTARAARRLLVGRIEEAQADIALALALDAANSEARALQAIVAVDLNNKTEALRLAEQAVAEDPTSAAALIALSYAQQAQFDLAAARASLETAAIQHPDEALTWARLAELRLATGALPEALAAAERAVALQASLAQPHTVLGFARLMSLDTERARASFEQAVQLNPAAPLPRLGLGLALIRAGELSAGRREIEIAVLLDPNDALVRSYVAKAYFEEHRDALPDSQLEMAKALDPSDPTPWFYDGLRKQTLNRPVEALRDLQQAAALNSERTVYRSRLLLDEDLAVRSAGLGRTYRDLGFEQLALVSGWQSVARDPGNYSGHRLLADTYSTRPRHQIARVNELFQSQLLQPLNLTAIPPQLGESNLFILDTAGPAELAFNEFNPLIARNHWTVQGAGIVAGNGTRGEHVTVSGIEDRLSYSLGQFQFESDGFRANNDIDTEVRNAFVQYRPNAATTFLGELRSSETEKGDLRLLFDPTNYSSLIRQTDAVDSVRLGVRRALDERNEVLAAVLYQDGEFATEIGAPFFLRTQFHGDMYEVQHLYQGNRWQFTNGLSLVRNDFTELSQFIIPLPFPPFEAQETEASAVNVQNLSAYSYGQYTISKILTATVGASVDMLEREGSDQDQLSPKLGLTWEPRPGTIIRAAAFRTLQGPFVSKQNIQPRLEPTQIAGFNQFYFGPEGEQATRYGLAIDQQWSPSVFFGAELSRGDLMRPILAIIPPSPIPIATEVDLDELLVRAYVYWTPNTSLALSAELQSETFDNNGEVLAEGFAKLTTHRMPLELKYFHPSGFSGGIKTTYVDQSGDFGVQSFGPGGFENMIVPDSESFWVVDASLSYRLPGRHGVLGVYVQNLLDETYRFQDTDPENPRIMPERLISFRFTLAF